MKYLLLIFLFVCLNGEEIAYVKSVGGTVLAKNTTQTIEVKQGDRLEDEMLIITQDNSNITIIFDDTSVLILGSNCLMNLQKYVFKPQNKEYEFKLFLKKGTLSFESGKIGKVAPESFILTTPEGVVAIRGTKFFVKAE